MENNEANESKNNARQRQIKDLMMKSPHAPLMLLPTPNSKTRVIGVRYSTSKEYLKESEGSLPINNGTEPPGACKVIDFESDLFIGTLILRVRGAAKGDEVELRDEAGPASDYFGKRKRTFQALVRGRFKADDIKMIDCVTGQVFERPPGNLPPKFLVNSAVGIMKALSPQLHIDFGSKPRFLSPLCATAQIVKLFHGTKDFESEQLSKPKRQGFWRESKHTLHHQSMNGNTNNGSANGGRSSISKRCVVNNDDYSEDEQRDSIDTQISAMFKALKRRTSSFLCGECSDIEFTEMVDEAEEIASKDTFELERGFDCKKETEIVTNHQTSNDHVFSRNMEIEMEEKGDSTSIINELQGYKLHSNTGKNAQMKNRKKVFNQIYSKRADSNSISPCFSSQYEIAFEFFQHLLLFDDFALKIPFHNVKLAGALNGQPLKFMACRQNGENKNSNIDYLWSFDIWHSSLLDDVQ